MIMKKIGIMTIHNDFNYGAVLQAVATQKFLELQGYDAEIINYENSVIAEQSKIVYKQGGRRIGYIVTFIRNVFFGRYFYYKKATNKLDLYQKKSETKYSSLDELDNSNYDVLIAGSDQIWNPIISRGIDPAFLLQFGNPEKRISISSSMGSYCLDDHEKDIFYNALKDFAAISVREEFAKEQLQPLITREVQVLCDPSFFLDHDIWWNEYAKKSRYADVEEKYIVTYFVGSNKRKYRKVVSQYAKKMNLPVWTIQYSNYNWKESDKKILGASIIDFIALIANAQLVITDSFHGVAFSLNMGTDFVALTNQENPVRVRELLTKIGENERIDMGVEEFHGLNVNKTWKSIEELRRESGNWIRKVLDN